MLYKEIEDNGTGISKDNLRRLFGGPILHENPKGMGTWIIQCAQHIIQSHNGTIEVESELNKGTKFIIGLNI